MGGVAYTLGVLGFALTAALSATPTGYLALVFFGGMCGSFLYTGGMGLKYYALGDVVVMLAFGPITVLFAYIAQSAQYTPLHLHQHLHMDAVPSYGFTFTDLVAPLAYSVPLVLNIEAILCANNVRDQATDASSGIVTLVMLLSPGGAYLLFCAFLFTPYLILAHLALHTSRLYWLPCVSVLRAFQLERAFRNGGALLHCLPKQTAQLNLVLGLTYVLAVRFAS